VQSLERTYSIELEGPPRRLGWISWDPVIREDGRSIPPKHGWRLLLEEVGVAEPLRSAWEEFFFEILRYPPEFGFPLKNWRQDWDGAVVDLEALQPLIDGRAAGPDDTPETAGLR
jgi:hypothetical protein